MIVMCLTERDYGTYPRYFFRLDQRRRPELRLSSFCLVFISNDKIKNVFLGSQKLISDTCSETACHPRASLLSSVRCGAESVTIILVLGVLTDGKCTIPYRDRLLRGGSAVAQVGDKPHLVTGNVACFR